MARATGGVAATTTATAFGDGDGDGCERDARGDDDGGDVVGDAWERVARRELDESADETNVRVDGSRWWARGGARGGGDARGWRVDDAASARRARRRDDGGKTRGVYRGGDGGGDAPGRRW